VTPVYHDPATPLPAGTRLKRVAAHMVERGYAVRDEQGNVERRPYTIVATYEDRSVLVVAPVEDVA